MKTKKELIRQWDALKYKKNLSGDEALKAVKLDGFNLRYVSGKNQTITLCLEAVKRTGEALQYVINPTPEICLAAVKKSGYALRSIINQTPELCIEAVKQDGYALRHVHNQTSKICLAAVEQNIDALQYVNTNIIDQWRKEIDNEKTIMIDGKPVSESTIKLALKKYFS